MLAHAINCRLRFRKHAAFGDLLDDADDRIPVALIAYVPKLELFAERRLAGEVAIRERLVHDRDRRIGLLIRSAEHPALAQTGADGCKVVAAHIANERDLAGHSVGGLALQPVESRICEVGERDHVDGSGADDAGKLAHLLQFRVDESDAAVEVFVAEQRSFKRQ